ncbi:MAG: L-histidine N(alpha)-methyltransferase [Acidobacteriaceae bacterium]|nr:L-histidine N(alpha)-methyltransferase [Acidobacteriaceae bacterium]MBV9034153.1 L-histidine N(alpha)-methyltransferase [Acidobacteriaceae bacterium]
MSTLIGSELSQFALDVAAGFSTAGGKRIAPRYFYDDLGSALFEAITLLPEYGLTRADERLLRIHADEIAQGAGKLGTVAELGSGNGKKTLPILRAVLQMNPQITYQPIDVSAAALAVCEREIGSLCEMKPVLNDWMQGMSEIGRKREENLPLLLLFFGSSVGNLDRTEIPDFFRDLRSHLRPGDFFLLGADLVKDIDTMIAAYDDPTGVTAAFNFNVLGRMNRELQANFDLRAFAHEVRWNSEARRIEMHLLSCRDQDVFIGALDRAYHLEPGETIWTESSHKFSEEELREYARLSGFTSVATWVDEEWPFAEALWRATE